ncbi:MAG: hypothetical protein HC908_17920 [Calothrix sp. SM1_7_51]|nr:hypothetical protein [Calothrix sp. SM1_7_51]
MDVQLVKLIVDLNKEARRMWGGIVHKNLGAYLNKIIKLFQDKQLAAAVIIIDNIHHNRVEEIKSTLKNFRFPILTEVRINFLDGGDLIYRFGKKDDNSNTASFN